MCWKLGRPIQMYVPLMLVARWENNLNMYIWAVSSPGILTATWYCHRPIRAVCICGWDRTQQSMEVRSLPGCHWGWAWGLSFRFFFLWVHYTAVSICISKVAPNPHVLCVDACELGFYVQITAVGLIAWLMRRFYYRLPPHSEERQCWGSPGLCGHQQWRENGGGDWEGHRGSWWLWGFHGDWSSAHYSCCGGCEHYSLPQDTKTRSGSKTPSVIIVSCYLRFLVCCFSSVLSCCDSNCCGLFVISKLLSHISVSLSLISHFQASHKIAYIDKSNHSVSDIWHY